MKLKVLQGHQRIVPVLLQRQIQLIKSKTIFVLPAFALLFGNRCKYTLTSRLRRDEAEGPDRSDNCPANRRIVSLICCICTTSYYNIPTNNYRLRLIE